MIIQDATIKHKLFSIKKFFRKLNLFRLWAFILLGICLSNCSPSPTPHLTISFVTTKDLNPDIEERPSPIVISIYQLKDDTSFIGSNFSSIYDKDESLLGSNLIRKREIELKPSQTYTLEDNLDKGTKFLGFIAAFRNINQAQWRQVIEITEDTTSNLKIKVDANKISILSD